MYALLTTTLFLGTAALVVYAIGSTLRRHGKQALGARKALRDCAPVQEVRFSIRPTGGTFPGLPPKGNVITLAGRRPAVPALPVAA